MAMPPLSQACQRQTGCASTSAGSRQLARPGATWVISLPEQSIIGTVWGGMISSIGGKLSSGGSAFLRLIYAHVPRWHGDPATTRPIQSRANGQGPPTSTAVEDADDDDQTPMDFASADPIQITNGINGIANDRSHPMSNYINPQTLRDIPPLPNSPSSAAGGPAQPNPSSSSAVSASDPTIVNIPVTQGLLHTYLQFLQVQTQTGKMKLEYLRRREEREERESALRRDMERLKMEREAAEFEHNKQTANTKQKMDRAIVSRNSAGYILYNDKRFRRSLGILLWILPLSKPREIT